MFSQLKPIVVVVEDVLAHTFWKMQHMATVHFENGHYHLHNELSDISEKENKNSQEKTPSSQKTNETISSHIVQQFDFQFENNLSSSQKHVASQKDVISVFIKINSPPPEA